MKIEERLPVDTINLDKYVGAGSVIDYLDYLEYMCCMVQDKQITIEVLLGQIIYAKKHVEKAINRSMKFI